MAGELPRLKSPSGRWIVLATVLGSSVAMLDGTVVNIALPRIGDALDADVAGLQWTLSGYTLTLASFILLGGALGDRLGRRKVFVWGTIGFAVASVLCGLAWNIEVLIAARVLQGIAGAMLTPGSLALISASIDPRDRGAAIGLWSGLGGVAGAIGPLLGGWLVEVASWRAVFLINVPLAVAVVLVSLRHVPESKDPNPPLRLDVLGAFVVALGLGALTYGLIDETILLALIGLVLLGVFVVIEMRSTHPLVPPSLFASRIFTAANLVTFAVYAALGGVFFLLLLQLQLVAGYSPLAAGVSTIPITVLMLVLSARAGRWSQRSGPRVPMTLGPVLAAIGLILMLRIGPDANYLLDVLPGVVVFGLGLSALVAPLTGAVLGSVPTAESGIASGVNNAVARTSQLLAVAALPGLAGLSGGAFADPVQFADGFRVAMWICVGLLLGGGAIAAIMIGKPERDVTSVDESVDCKPHCAIVGPAVAPGVAVNEGAR
ncbi:MFS transporter [Antrihabitans sp. YC3-6]|uniref:MFS transporter n=1 Tax=Antrihabitans stalagmiti TaxID=2799499 RepID=A0A934U6K8_9NOCA|nr:MFS transporter [Antrihabitans stalagmiti]MBJ8342616.1 MFS transporter [Antrihabitans stalagmiti]